MVDYPLYYVKDLEELARYIEDDEVLQGSNLSNTLETNPDGIADESNIDLKLHAAQCEVEGMIANLGFNLVKVRQANNTAINNAVAVVCWWNMEINADRDLIYRKYRMVIDRINGLKVIIAADGTAIYPDDNTVKTLESPKGRPYVGSRRNG